MPGKGAGLADAGQVDPDSLRVDLTSSWSRTYDLAEQQGALAMAEDAALLDVLREVVDPELMINIVDLGLVYDIEQVDNKVTVQMTLTSPACPAGPQIIQQAKMALEKLSDVSEAEIKLVMSPPWTPDRMTDEARDQLGIF
jgi:metal-sulfur cluster biosynthetic enzyme